MRKIKLYMPFLFLSLILVSCSEDQDQMVMTFKLQYDGQPMVMFDEYTYPSGETFNISRFSFYISQLNLLNGNEAVELVDVDYIDLTMYNIDREKSEKGFEYIINGIDPSGFEGISFNLGVTEAMNNTLPSQYGSGHPLALTSEYWSGWMSYIFTKIEGNVDLDGNGSLEQGIALHMGSDAAFREVNLAFNGEDEVTVIIDLKNIFENQELYDISDTPQIHNLSQLEKINQLMDNFAEGIELVN